MIKLIFKLFCIIAVALAGCSNIQDESGSIEAHFCPKEDCSRIMEHEIRNASKSISCAFYDLDIERLIDSLSDKSREIDARIIIEADTLNGQIKGPGIKKDKNPALMHNKFCIIDDYLVTTGSMNPTHNDNEKNFNNLVVIKSRTAAEKFNEEFNEMWSGKFGGGNKVKNNEIRLNHSLLSVYFCPEDGCEDALIKEINSAENSVYFMAFSFTSREISDAIIKKKQLDIRGVIDSGQAAGQYSAFDKMADAGIHVIKDNKKYKLHHKVFIIDNETVITGSFNPTLNGDTRNDENMISIKDRAIASQFLEEFEGLWN